MSRIIIETFQGGEYSVYAIARYDGQIIENGGCGYGDSDRSAAHSAINSLVKRAELAREEVTTGLGLAASPATPPMLSPEDAGYEGALPPIEVSELIDGSYMTYRTILTALEDWLAGDRHAKVVIDYVDARDNETTREIRPTKLDLRSGNMRPFLAGGAFLTAIDIEKDEPRHFRVDGITKLVIG